MKQKRLRKIPGVHGSEQATAKAVQNAFDIAVNYRLRLVEGNAGNSRGSVATNSRQVGEFTGGLREVTGMLFHNFARRLVKHASAAVVSKATPSCQHRRQARRCQRLQRGKALKKFLVVGDYGGDAGLLQHDLG